MRSKSLMLLKTAALLVAVSFCVTAVAQGRLSLAERVQRLENQNQAPSSGQATVELLNRINELQTEVQSLRGLVEQQNFEIESLKKAQRDRYIDLDSRLNRLEGNGGLASSPTTTDTVPSAALNNQPVDGQLQLNEPVDNTNSSTPPIHQEQSGLPAVPPSSQTPVSSSSAEETKQAYEDAFAALRDGRYAESARRFSAFLQMHPDTEFSDNARYWLGESYYVTQNYRVALETFNELLSRDSESAKAPDALLKVGYCYYELHDWDKAEAALNEVVQRYPDTTVARLAQGRLRALRLEGQQN
jgi:tol-pal system protein YbgF